MLINGKYECNEHVTNRVVAMQRNMFELYEIPIKIYWQAGSYLKQTLIDWRNSL